MSPATALPDLYGRRTEVLVAGLRLAAPELSIDFRVAFDDDPEPDEAVITVYNLSDDTASRLAVGQRLILNAGYRDDVGTLFTGHTTDIRGRWEGPTRMTQITVADAAASWEQITISKTYGPGTTTSEILRDIVRETGIALGALQVPTEITYHRGRAINGSLPAVLRELAADCGAQVYVANDALSFRGDQGGGTRTGFVLRADTGLIESPQRVDRQDAGETTKSWGMWMLLNHRLGPGSLLQVESRTVTGLLRVRSGQHVSNDADHQTYVEAVPA